MADDLGKEVEDDLLQLCTRLSAVLLATDPCPVESITQISTSKHDFVTIAWLIRWQECNSVKSKGPHLQLVSLV